VVALGLAGCGGDRSGGPRGTPDEIIGSAPEHTVGARTARVTIDAIDARATGVVDFVAGASQLDLWDGTTVLLVGGAVYTRPKGATQWRHATVDDLPASLRPADPSVAVDLVNGAGDIRSDGGAEVRGASTLAYTVKVDPLTAAGAVPAGRAAAVRSAADIAGPGVVQLEVLVDAAGRIRRIQVPVPLRAGPPTTRPDGEYNVVTIDFDNFGTPATIAAPAPTDIAS
jgi:hypothetical protein